MKRALIVSVITLVFFSGWQSLGIYMPGWLNLFFLPPIVLVFIMQYFKPLETIYTSLMCGIVIDILGGFLIGTNMLLMLFFSFVLGAINIFSGRLYVGEIVFYVVPVSCVYRITLLVGQVIFSNNRANIYIFQLLLGPLIDALLSVVFYCALVKILILVKLFDRTEFFKNPIGLSK